MIQDNIDPEALHQFDQMADSWWDPMGVCKPLHAINPARLQFIQQQLGQLARLDILDVGCGGGILTEALAREHANVTGLDPSVALIQVARAHAQSEALVIDYIENTIEHFLKHTPRHFAVVTCMELLEHVPDPAALVAACSQLTQADGHVFFSTINRKPKAWLMAILGAEYCLGWLPRGTHRYEQFIQPAELAAAARKAGLTVMECQGIRYHPLSGSWRLSQTVDVNYLMYCRK